MISHRHSLAAGVATLALVFASQSVSAQTNDSADEQAEEAAQPQSASEIVVQAEIGYRNRSDDAEPVLVYDEEYFQRFEPLTAGDALKRVPSVTFLSDVIESDGVRLRGLDPGYTQILINGEKVPGPNADRSFFLDRIPAELIEQVEIVRSSSARRTGDAVAGTLNIKLRDAFTLDGGYVKGGALLFRDATIKPSGGFYYGGALGPGRVLFGANIQGRYNPKLKQSFRYGDSPENNPDFATDDFDNREDQTDTRDGTDYALNGSWAIDGSATDFEIAGNFVRTNRVEDERSFEYDDPTAVTGPVRNTPAGNLLTDNRNVADIEQQSWSVSSKLSQEWSAGKTSLRATYARFDDDRYETENEIDFDRATPRLTADVATTDQSDSEFSLALEHAVPAGAFEVIVGGFYQDKDRDSLISDNQAVRNRRNLTVADRQLYNQFLFDPNTYVTTRGTLAPVLGGDNRIEEQRIDAFALIEGETGAVDFEVGLRWENTDVTILDRAAGDAGIDTSYDFLLPSASAKIALGDGRITVSAARTMRRPNFNFIAPVTLEAELGDNDLLGNPQLRPETAWGGDLGYEHRLGRTGVAGVNLFYRNVSNLVELANTGAEGSEGPGTFVFQPRNSGEGEVWGVEFDLSTSLGFLGLPETGVFGNLALIDSTIEDVFGSRRFNGQSEYVYNFGFIQNLPSWAAAFGATYRKQGAAYDRVIGEEVVTTYGADLEVFVEKRFGDSFTIRAVGSNLLDGRKDEVFNKFTTVEDQANRDFDEYELESERAGAVFQLVARYAF